VDLGAVGRRRPADAAGEERAEAAQAGKADVEAHVGDGAIGQRQQAPRAIEARGDPQLVRRLAEHGPEPADELERRQPGRGRRFPDAHAPPRSQQRAGAAQIREGLGRQLGGDAHRISACVRPR
jgi:hypothetical protein